MPVKHSKEKLGFPFTLISSTDAVDYLMEIIDFGLQSTFRSQKAYDRAASSTGLYQNTFQWVKQISVHQVNGIASKCVHRGSVAAL